MIKTLITAFAIGTLLMTGIASPVQAQSKPCTKAPKDYTPCFVVTPQGAQRSKPQVK